jgi:tetratricopeptide (TPR) repeat protein
MKSLGQFNTDEEHAFREAVVDEFSLNTDHFFKPEVFMDLLYEEAGERALGVLSILNRGDYNFNHRFLARAAKLGDISFLTTTNFDQYIEKALEAEGVSYRLYSDSSQFRNLLISDKPMAEECITVLKLHGTLERPETIRMTLQQAAKPLETEKAQVLRHLLERYTVLFYGYSANDDDIFPIILSSRDVSVGIIWCLWDAHSVTHNVNAILSMYGEKARVLNQNKQPIFPELSNLLGYEAVHVPDTNLESIELESSQNEIALEVWAASLHPAAVLHVLASTCRTISAFELAKIAFWKEQDLLEQEARWKDYARTTRALGVLFDIQHDYNTAFDCYAESFALTQKIGDRLGFADSCTKLSRLEMYLNDSQKALELLEDSIRIYEELQLPLRLAEALNNMAEVLLLGLHQIDDAQQRWGRSLEILEQEGDLLNAAAACSNLALTFRLQNNLEKAKALLEHSISLELRHGNLHGAGLGYGNLAFLEEENSEYEKALCSISKAIEIFQRVGTHEDLEKHQKIKLRISDNLG